jgi:hypothetical protein
LCMTFLRRASQYAAATDKAAGCSGSKVVSAHQHHH